MHVGIAGVLFERDDLVAAAEHLADSHGLGEYNGLPQNPYRWRVAMARLREIEGDLDGALELLDEADRLYVGDYLPNVRPVSAMRGGCGYGAMSLTRPRHGRPSGICPRTTSCRTCTSTST
jgi:LuxR family maltose regulon positive regulatory protein